MNHLPYADRTRFAESEKDDSMAQDARHDSSYAVQAPRHPVSQLQGPFEESMLEAVHDEPEDIHLDPITRRNTLLEAPVYTRVVAGRWKQKPGERFHPLWKLIAQISFGIHLLAEGMAKSEDEVMQILQAHVDEIDGFLERTTEDFDLAQEDIQERLRCLKLPLSHPATFDKMLEDRNFRLSIVEGNEKIEHIVERTSQAMKDSLKDVQKGFDSTSCLETYLQGLSATWARQSVEHEAVFVAMLGNVEGWRKAFMSLHMQGNKLGGSLKKLTDIINEMQARAGEVSRRLLHQARVQHQQVMGRPTGRSTPTSRFQTAQTKQLPTIHDRPALRQTASHDTVRTMPTIRSSSQNSLRHQPLFSRSQTPQHDMPAPRQVRNAASPRIIQIGSNSQGRVQSMVPSLMEAATPRDRLVVTQPRTIDEEQQPERYFPPVELPAHVPEETMRTVPMSKQNRLSVGLGIAQASKTEKRNSRLGTSALVDLLRSNPMSGTTSSTSSPKSPAVSRRTPTMLSDESSSAGKPVRTISSPPRSSSASDATATHVNNNKRQPKKGAQHWSDAPANGLLEDDKSPEQENFSSQRATVAAQIEPKSSDLGSGPSTPSWAVTSFAQAEKKKELLKKGAFSSHPPDVPLGSPPLVQNSFQNPLVVAPPQRRPSHASSTGQTSLGEPGPEVAASEAGSASAYSGRHNQTMKRASAHAPEVVVEKVPPLPGPIKQFIAEMEGSSPVIPGVQQSSSSIRDVVMELEAPQQYFKLPPRPKLTESMETVNAVGTSEGLPEQFSNLPPQATKPSKPEVAAELGAYQQHFRLPPRPQPSPPVTFAQAESDEPPEQETRKQEEANQCGLTASMGDQALVQSPTTFEGLSQQELVPSLMHDEGKLTRSSVALELGEVTEQSTDLDADEQRLSSKTFVTTPNVPLPPSPYGEDDTEPEPEEPLQKPAQEATLYFLPALAYKPPSPQLPPDPVLHKREAEPEPEPKMPSPQPVAETTADTQPVPAPGQLGKYLDGQPSPAHTSATQLASPMPGDQNDPYGVVDGEPQLSSTIVPTSTIPKAMTTTATLRRDHKPAKINDTRNSDSTDSQNSWKAFFTGQPSPVGSNLSIRSIKRESILEQRPRSRGSPYSAALASPASASSRHALPPSPSMSPDVANSAKDTVWFNKPFDDVTSSSVGKTLSHDDEPSGKPATQEEGLGITI